MATSAYTRNILKVVVAQICQTIGWHSIQTTPLEVLTDVLSRYIHSLGTSAHRYGEQFGHTEPTIVDIALAFKDLGVSVQELEEYVEYVAPVPCAVNVPKYPLERESHLNLLKPGSREVVTRPVHIHEHLPAMHPQLEEDEPPLSVDITGSESGTSPLSSPKNSLFKRPGDPVSVENNLLKRARMMLEEEGRPLREISSVMMTTSGFLSPAREGKLPEARTPTQASDSRSSSPQPLSYPTVPPEVKGEKKSKKFSNRSATEGIRKLADKEISKTKDTTSSQNTEDDDPNVKKLVSMKEMYKLKALKPGAIKMHSPNNGVKKANKHKNAPGMSAMISSLPKIPKLNQKNKSEKSTGGQSSSKSGNDKNKDVSVIDGKLSSEPDKQKLNIFKKISKVKEDKQDLSDSVKMDSGPSEENRHRDIISETIEAVIQKSREQQAALEKSELVEVESSDSELFCYNDDLSPPGTPSTPRTPDLLPPQRKPNKHQDSKKKKKGKRDRDKKDSHSSSPKRFKSESTESDYSLLEKPKTPEVESSRDDIVPILPRNREDMMASNVFQFFPFAPGPGLIPPPMAANNPLFNRLNMPLGKQGAGLMLHPAMPNLPLPPPLLGHPPAEPQVKSSLSPSPQPVSRTSPTPVPPTVTITSVSAPSPSPVSEVVITETKIITPPKDKSGEKKKEKEHKKEKKDKIKKKKDKKDKLKNKDKGDKKKIKSGKKIKEKNKNKEKKDKKEKKKEKEREEKEKEKGEGSVPKLTLKLGPPSPQPGTQPAPPEPTHRKMSVIKPIEPPREVKEEKRSPSPELARISALVTRPSNSKPPVAMPVAPHSVITSASPNPSSVPSISLNLLKQAVTQAPRPKIKELPKKPVQVDSEKKEPLAFYFDNEGNQVWICPACGGQDDGSPMIGCDGCDAWYHWVCVGIQVPPDSNDWFCRVCISKKQDGLSSEKKKKGERRKKKTGST